MTTAAVPCPVMQFGTSRFLQAHVDLFVSDDAAAGPIAVVQTTGSAESWRRIEGFRTMRPYPVLIRGRLDGKVVERRVEVGSVGAAWHAEEDWAFILEQFVTETRLVVCNTGDTGWRLDPRDAVTPHSFPARLSALLRARFEAGATPLVMLPCELLSANGTRLRELMLSLAPEPAFRAWLHDCVWANSLVDRIVSEALKPVGAIAEPYALWAIEAGPGVLAPCVHPDVRIVPDLRPYERLKLFILNLGHSVLAERWLADGAQPELTVAEAIAKPEWDDALRSILQAEVLPVFAAIGMAAEAVAYQETVIDRFANPFLRHRLSDIAQNHSEKKQRRIAPLLDLAREQGLVPGRYLSSML